MMLNRNSKNSKKQFHPWSATLLTGLGITGLLTGCSNTNLMLAEQVNAQDLPTAVPPATLPATPTPSPTILPTVTPTRTPIPTNTPWPTPTAWPTPQNWAPAQLALPTLAPLPLAPNAVVLPSGGNPVSYSPPNGVDVFGNTILRWAYSGQLAPDEFFDIKIKPFGSNDSAFVDWSKSTDYVLQPWSGWQPGLYHWQIGIVKGYLDENGAKHFIADTGHDSELFVIKWQAPGNGGGGNNGAGSGGGGGGGGNTSGGS